MTNITRDILIEQGKTGIVWVVANSGCADFGETYIPARRVAMYHVGGALKSMNTIYERLIL